MISSRMWSLISEDAKSRIQQIIAEDINEIMKAELGYSLVQNISNAKKQILVAPKQAQVTKESLVAFGRTFRSIAAMSNFFEVPTSTLYGHIKRGEDVEAYLKKKSPKIAEAQQKEQQQTVIKRNGAYPIH